MININFLFYTFFIENERCNMLSHTKSLRMFRLTCVRDLTEALCHYLIQLWALTFKPPSSNFFLYSHIYLSLYVRTMKINFANHCYNCIAKKNEREKNYSIFVLCSTIALWVHGCCCCQLVLMAFVIWWNEKRRRSKIAILCKYDFFFLPSFNTENDGELIQCFSFFIMWHYGYCSVLCAMITAGNKKREECVEELHTFLPTKLESIILALFFLWARLLLKTNKKMSDGSR